MPVRIFALALLSLQMLVAYADQPVVWTKQTGAALFNQSQVVMEGELIGFMRVTLPKQPDSIKLAILRANRFLKGQREDHLFPLVIPEIRPGYPVPMGIHYREGMQGMWFLRESPEKSGFYLADHPQRYIPLTDKEKIMDVWLLLNP